MVNEPEVGDVVVALQVIVDVDPKGRPYLHAVKGTHGVVVGVVRGDWPTVAWGLRGEGGVCDVPPGAIDYAPSDSVCWAVDFNRE